MAALAAMAAATLAAFHKPPPMAQQPATAATAVASLGAVLAVLGVVQLVLQQGVSLHMGPMEGRLQVALQTPMQQRMALQLAWALLPLAAAAVGFGKSSRTTAATCTITTRKQA